MNDFDWNPGTLLAMSGYYWKTCTLHAGVRLDIFTALKNKTQSVQDLSRSLSLDLRGVEVLLNALAAMELIKKTGETYENTAAASEFLSKDSPRYIGYMIMHHFHLMDSWHKMDHAVREGKPVRDRSSFSDAERRESFLMGMFNMAMAIAPGLSREIDLKGCTRLLDLGGGPGTFAIHFCLANPELTAAVFDLPTTRPFAEKTIQRFRVPDRVSFVPGDYTETEIPGPGSYDAAWLSHILHGEGPEQAREIVGKAVRALKPGSKLFIHEFILNNEKSGPLFPALFAMNMYLGTPDGRSYSEQELSGMLTDFGVTKIQRLPFEGPTQSGILCGITP